MKPAEVAELLRISARTLEAWRAKGEGPPHQKHGRRVAYPHEAVLAWARNQETKGSGAKATNPLKEAEVTAWPYAKDHSRYQVSMPYLHPITGAEVRVRKLAPADRRTLESAKQWGEAERLRIVSAIVRDAPKPKEEPKHESKPETKAKAPTLAEFWPLFHEKHVSKLKRSSCVCYGVARRHFEVIGSTPMDGVDEDVLEKLREHLEDQGIGIPTQKMYFAKLAKMVRWAMARRKIPRVVIPRLEFEPVKRKPVPIYSPGDLEQLLAQAGDPYERVILLLLADGALRIGETAGLQWTDIHYDREEFGTMEIKRNVVLGYLQDSAKGEDGEVPITPRLAQALRDLQAAKEHAVWVLPRRTKIREREEHGGARGRGEHSDEALLAALVTRLQEAAGLAGYGPHRVRHSRLTHLAERMVPLRALQHLARHSKESTTEKYYLHVRKVQAARVAIEELIEMTSPTLPGKSQAKSGKETQNGVLH